MKHLFVTYQLALLAKEKGFDEYCLAYYSYCLEGEDIELHTTYTDFYPEDLYVITNAPLYQQLVDWFREKHAVFIYPNIREQFLQCRIWTKFPPHYHNTDIFSTPNEALTAALTEAFKLI